MPKTIAVIPAKGISRRLPRKNFREFFAGQSLLQIKIGQCVGSGIFDEVFVSSESDEARDLCDDTSARFVRRDERLCQDDSLWSDVLVGVIEDLPIDDDTLVAWCPPTSPLFTRYGEAIDLIGRDGRDSVMTVTRHQHFMLNERMIPVNFQFGVWAGYSQGLAPFFQMNCALWAAPREKMIRNRFQIGDTPAFFETPASEAVDIDTPEDFDIALALFAHKANRAAHG